ncbi:hypothetical protein PG997_002610 [Apiospora hydei]|uniref:NmrA-like domain-containing protein n=1 Tax=Apiospora hydei TaxID=1337664 RepID=A0ABR1WX10_9PEZI
MSINKSPTVFVCGATGSQGGALVSHLRGLNWAVHATVRNLVSPAARALEAAGVQLTQGDWDDHLAIKSSVTGCDKAFICLLPDFNDLDRERRQTEAIVNIAKAAGVTQVVTSTSVGVFTLEDPSQDIAPGSIIAQHLAGKKGVEEAVRHGDFDHWTFLRPTFFMANFLEPKVARYSEPRDKGTWTTALLPDTKLALLDHADVAAFAAVAFENPGRFHDRAIGIASEYLTVQQTLDTLGQAAGRSFKAVYMTEEEISEKSKTSNVFANSQVSMRYMRKYLNMDEIKSVIRPTGFKDFLEREEESVRKTYP